MCTIELNPRSLQREAAPKGGGRKERHDKKQQRFMEKGKENHKKRWIRKWKELKTMEIYSKWVWNNCVSFKGVEHEIGEGNGTPLQYSCLENPMDGGAWWAAVHEVAESRTRLSDFTFTFHFDALEKEMATHSSVLGWRIPGTGEPGGLLSMGSHRVGHDWSDLA